MTIRIRTSAPGQPEVEGALDGVEHGRPGVVLEHVLPAGGGERVRGVGRLGHEAQALLELVVVVVHEAGAGPLAVPAVHRARAGGDHHRPGEPGLHDRAGEALVGRRLDVAHRGGERVVAFVVGDVAEVDHAVRDRGRRVDRAVTHRHERQRQVGVEDGTGERPEHAVPVLPALAPTRIDDERALDAVPRPEALRVVRRGDVDAGADHLVGRQARVDRLREVTLGVREEPEPAGPGEEGPEQLEARLGLVVQARHEDRAVRCDLPARERRPEQVRREHECAVRLRVVEQEVEQVGQAEVVVHPPLLVGQAQGRAGDDRGVERGPLGARGGDHRREAVQHDAVVHLLGARWEDVLPGEVVTSAGGEDLDVPPAPGEAVGHLAQHGLGAADHAVAVARGKEAEAALAFHEGVTVPVALAGPPAP